LDRCKRGAHNVLSALKSADEALERKYVQGVVVLIVFVSYLVTALLDTLRWRDY
jgi:hypothetical protein